MTKHMKKIANLSRRQVLVGSAAGAVHCPSWSVATSAASQDTTGLRTAAGGRGTRRGREDPLRLRQPVLPAVEDEG